MLSRYYRVLRVPYELRLCRVLLRRRWAFFQKNICMPEASRVAHGSRLRLSRPPRHRAAVPYHTDAVSRVFGRDNGGEAARWRDGEAGPASAITRPQATAGSATEGPPFELRAGRERAVPPGGMRPYRGSGRGPQRRPGEAPAVIWSAHGEAAPRTAHCRSCAGPCPCACHGQARALP